MKIVAFADPHESLTAIKEVEKKAEKADLIVCTGDVSIFEQELETFLERMNKIGKKILLIHGNHEGEEITETLSQGLKNIELIHKKIHRIGNYAFIGYGGTGFEESEPEFENFIEETSSQIKPEEKLVLVTHGPAHGTKLDLLWNDHRGCKSFTQYIKKSKPVLYLCGHFHETFGIIDKLGNTKLVNPGPKGILIEI